MCYITHTLLNAQPPALGSSKRTDYITIRDTCCQQHSTSSRLGLQSASHVTILTEHVALVATPSQATKLFISDRIII